MKYTPQEVIQFIQEEDVKFIRLAFCDCFGRPKNISIMPHELERAFKYGIAIDASAIAGFGDEVNSDLFLHPDASTIALLPWRPEHGSVVRMFCSITHPDGTPFAHDTRGILKQAVADAAKAAASDRQARPNSADRRCLSILSPGVEGFVFRPAPAGADARCASAREGC